jgi:hypothetical protein
MRAGPAVLGTIEALMNYFNADEHIIRLTDPDAVDGAGYRTGTRNDGTEGASSTSHHPDGVASDITLANSSPGAQQPIQCEVLLEASVLIGGHGEVLDEGKTKTVHISIPGLYGRDWTKYKEVNGVKKYFWACP